MKSPTHITFRNTSVIDHVLGCSPSQILQHGVINVTLSNCQLIYCTSKISKITDISKGVFINRNKRVSINKFSLV